MKRILSVCGLALLMVSCGAPKTLYYWGGVQNGVTKYEHLAYLQYDKQTSQALCRLICTYEDIVRNPGGKRKTIPPGVCAEYGYILLQASTAETFASYATAAQKRIFDRTDYAGYFQEYGKELLQNEMQLYPESVLFIRPLIEKLAGR